MAQTIGSMMAAVIRWTTNYNLTVVDAADPGGRTVSINPTGTRYYRVFLGAFSGGTTASAAIDLLQHLEDQLNATTGATDWAVEMLSTGFVKITYSGLGTASITWDAGLVVPKQLGYAGTDTGTLDPGLGTGSTTATYHPTHVVYSLNRAKATDWVQRPPPSALAEMDSGEVYGWTGGKWVQSYTFDSEFHPRTWTVRASTSAAATPAISEHGVRMSLATAVSPPWSVEDALVYAGQTASWGQHAGFALGTFQTLVSGGSTAFDIGALSAETLQAAQTTRVLVPNLTTWRTWPNVTVRKISNGYRV